MVGIPRSKGCLTCISRRVKCDEERPECTQCKRGNRKCGGYNRPAKFVNAAPESIKNPKPSSGNRSTSHFRTNGNGHSSVVAFSGSGSNSSGSNRNLPLGFSWTTVMQSSPRAELLSPQVELAQTLSVFLASFNPSATQKPGGAEELKVFTPWLRFIPSYLGKSHALDPAIACLSLHTIGSFSKNKALVRDSFRYYGRALHGLRRSIMGGESALAPETLCATMILTIYELFACTKESSWVQHAGGAGQLMKARGPDRHMTGFERSMFNAFRGIILLESVVSGAPCFLELPEWKKITMFPDRDPKPIELLVEEFYNTTACLPRLRKETKKIIAGKEANISREELVSNLIDLQIYLDNCVDSIKIFTNTPLETMSSRGDDMFPFVYMFEHNFTASLFCHCAAFSLIIRRSLGELRVPGWDAPLIRNRLVGNICKTVEYATSTKAGVFGGFYIVFNLRVAYIVAKEPVKSWIGDKLNIIAKFIPVAHFAPEDDDWPEVEDIVEEIEVS